MGMKSHISITSDDFSSYHVSLFFNDESENDGSGSSSSGTCSFPFCFIDSVGRVSGVGSGVFVLNFT